MARKNDGKGLSTNELCAAAGVTLRQVHYWRERGYITPGVKPGTGRPGDYLRWSEANVAEAKALAAHSAIVKRGLAPVARRDTPGVRSTT